MEEDGGIFLKAKYVNDCVVSVNVRVRMPVACAAAAGKIQEYWFCARISTLLDGENSSQRDVNMENLSMTAQIIASKLQYGDVWRVCRTCKLNLEFRKCFVITAQIPTICRDEGVVYNL